MSLPAAHAEVRALGSSELAANWAGGDIYGTHRISRGMPTSAATLPVTDVPTTALQAHARSAAKDAGRGRAQSSHNWETGSRRRERGAQAGQREPGKRANVCGEAGALRDVAQVSAPHRQLVRFLDC